MNPLFQQDGKRKNSFRRAIKKATTKDGAETENQLGIVGCVENAIRQSKDSNEVFHEKNQTSSEELSPADYKIMVLLHIHITYNQ